MRPENEDVSLESIPARWTALTELLANDVGTLLSAKESRAVGVGTCGKEVVRRHGVRCSQDDVPRLSGQRERLQIPKSISLGRKRDRRRSSLGDLEVAGTIDVQLR